MTHAELVEKVAESICDVPAEDNAGMIIDLVLDAGVEACDFDDSRESCCQFAKEECKDRLRALKGKDDPPQSGKGGE